MTGTVFTLDALGHHHLHLALHPGGWRVRLSHQRGQRQSALHAALLSQLNLHSGPHQRWLDPRTDAAELPPGPLRVELGSDPATPLLRAEGERIEQLHLLSPFEARYLAEHERPHPPAPPMALPQLVTDLHSHFAGCPRGKDLVALGCQLDLPYPTTLLAELGIHVDGEQVRLRDLSEGMLQSLAWGLGLPEDQQTPFAELEAIYRRRAPLTKSPAALVPLLSRIAEDYAAMGVRYAELSWYDVLKAEVLRTIHRELPAIEARTGVRLRFLAAFSRHDDFEWDLDLLDRLETLLPSDYLVGVDVMGHETNSSAAFAEVLRRLGRLATRARPGLVVRVHAGENPAHPENIRVVTECLEDEAVELRIGHGLYGVDEPTLQRLVRQRAIVELNLSSNLALNNIRSINEVPLRRYLDAGVRLVLGTDGYGVYGTTLPMEVQAARLSGLGAQDFAALARTELELLEGRGTSPRPFVVPDDAPPSYFSPKVQAKKQAQAAAWRAAWEARRQALGLPWLDAASLDALAVGRRVVAFAGAWRRSYARIPDDQRTRLEALLGEVLRGLDPRTTLVLTGGTIHGVEGLIQRLAAPLGLMVVGGIVTAHAPLDVDGVGLTHLTPLAETLYEKAVTLYGFLDRHDGLPVFIGGGPIVQDEIRTAANLRLRYWLLAGIDGAADDCARHAPERSFTTAEELLRTIHDDRTRRGHQAPYWHLGPNPTVDLVITRRHPIHGHPEVLLIQRSYDAASEPGRWALPGGFVHTDAPRGTPWTPGAESFEAAARRELAEETSLHLPAELPLTPAGVYEGGGRDPRDTAAAWSQTHVYSVELPSPLAAQPIAGADDAQDAAWFRFDGLPRRLAFDHTQILAQTLNPAKEPR